MGDFEQTSSYHYGQSDIPDKLIQDLQKIFTDPANDDKVTSAKQAIFQFAITKAELKSPAAPIELEGMVSVTRVQLETWLEKIRAYNMLQIDLENDIGWISKAIDNIIHSSNPMKLVPKILMGKIDLKEIGLDEERLEAISRKYAPKTYEQLQQKKTKK